MQFVLIFRIQQKNIILGTLKNESTDIPGNIYIYNYLKLLLL